MLIVLILILAVSIAIWISFRKYELDEVIIRLRKEWKLIRKRHQASELYRTSFKKEFRKFLKDKNMTAQYHGMVFYVPAFLASVWLFIQNHIWPKGWLVGLFGWAALLGTGFFVLNGLMCIALAVNAADIKGVEEVRASRKA